MSEVVARCIVTRAHPDLPPSFLPHGWEGRWWDMGWAEQVDEYIRDLNGHPLARIVRTDRFERREDGLTARVYEIWPAPDRPGFVQPDRPM